MKCAELSVYFLSCVLCDFKTLTFHLTVKELDFQGLSTLLMHQRKCGVT